MQEAHTYPIKESPARATRQMEAGLLISEKKEASVQGVEKDSFSIAVTSGMSETVISLMKILVIVKTPFHYYGMGPAGIQGEKIYASSTGSVIVNIAPPSLWFFTEISPPWVSIIHFVMASPRPEPPERRDLVLSTR